MKLGIGLPVFLAVFAVPACCEPPPPKTVVVTCIEGGDAGTPESFDADQSPEALSLKSPCARACANLAKLGCPESFKLPAGKTCVETCKDISSISSFNPECVAGAKDVTAVRKCPQVTCKN